MVVMVVRCSQDPTKGQGGGQGRKDVNRLSIEVKEMICVRVERGSMVL